jgi:Caspase domain
MPELTDMTKGSSPGLWTNRKWSSGTPGLYAVVIGISTYKHLDGGIAPAPERYGLPQLAVSALTAFRIFQWLTKQYYVSGCPLAQCWLLLEPSQPELTFEPELEKYVVDAKYTTCEQALGYWHRELMQVNSASANASRSFFFFSGHGLEAHGEDQVLLPSDYLAPPNYNITKALSTRNLQAALASSPVSRQFFYIDACRNDHDDLRKKGLAGTKILTEDEPAMRNKNLVAPVLYATSTGSQAWQQPSPNAGLSLFGTALLDGLRGQPDIRLECGADLCSVRIYSLQPFVENSVVKQLAAANSSYGQPVRLGGSSRDEDVTFLRASDTSGPPDVPVRKLTSGTPLTGETALTELTKIREASTGHRKEVVTNTVAWATHDTVGHEIFARETVTAIWSRGLRLYAFGSKQMADPNDLKLQRVTLDRARTGYRVELTFLRRDSKGFWLELQDLSGRWFGVVLPTDKERPLQYLLEMQVSPDGTRILDMPGKLAQNEDRPIEDARALWLRYQTGDLNNALTRYDLNRLEDLVFGKAQSPLAAIIASLVLLRANRLERLREEWLQNLTKWFPQFPDSAVLLAEKRLREGKVGPACEALLILLERELPFTSEAMGYASAMIERFGGVKEPLTNDQIAGLVKLKDRFKEWLAHFRSGGLFVTLTGQAADNRPWPIPRTR